MSNLPFVLANPHISDYKNNINVLYFKNIIKKACNENIVHLGIWGPLKLRGPRPGPYVRSGPGPNIENFLGI